MAPWAALDACPRWWTPAPGDFPVLFDSASAALGPLQGVALGGRRRCSSRPYVLGLGLGAPKAPRDVLRGLLADFDLTLARSGTRGRRAGPRRAPPARRFGRLKTSSRCGAE